MWVARGWVVALATGLFACAAQPASHGASGGPNMASGASGATASSAGTGGAGSGTTASPQQGSSAPAPGASTTLPTAGGAGAGAGAGAPLPADPNPTTPETTKDPAPAKLPDFAHTFEAIDIAAGQEQTGVCQAWTLGNSDPIFVNRIEENNDGGFHHSNWIWVPDTAYTGPDGTFKCADRGFDQILAGAQGGVFFAQSTQARLDVQAFPSGVAFQMPAHVRIIGDVHLLNASTSSVTTRLSFALYALPQAEVKIALQPMAFTNTSLDIAPSTTTHARMQCATPEQDFDIYYILPHFHALGTGMTIDVAGGPMAGKVIYDFKGNLGDGWGETFDPPIAVRGAAGLGVSCLYDNPRPASVHYGEGDQEMCVTLIYTNGAKAGGTTLSNYSTTDSGGIHSTEALCLAVGAP